MCFTAQTEREKAERRLCGACVWWRGVKPDTEQEKERKRQTHIDVSVFMVCSCSLISVAISPTIPVFVAMHTKHTSSVLISATTP